MRVGVCTTYVSFIKGIGSIALMYFGNLHLIRTMIDIEGYNEEIAARETSCEIIGNLI